MISYRPPLPILLREKPIHRFGLEMDVRQNRYLLSAKPPSSGEHHGQLPNLSVRGA